MANRRFGSAHTGSDGFSHFGHELRFASLYNTLTNFGWIDKGQQA